MIDKILWFVAGAAIASILYTERELKETLEKLRQYKELFK